MTIRNRATTALLALSVASAWAQTPIKLIVGTYTDRSSKGIYTYNFNESDGTISALDTLELKNPSFLTITNDGKNIYAVSENNDETACVNAINFDSTTGKMSLINSQPTHGADPCYVATNDNFLLTANYTGGSLSLFPVNLDGSLGQMAMQFKGNTGGTFIPNQQLPHMHTAVFTPDGSYVLVSDFSSDHILRYEISGMEEIKYDGIAGQVAAGSGPRHLTFSADSRFFYVISELSGNIDVFRWNYGKSKKIQTIGADKVGGHGSADIHISPDGKYLYASNRLKNDGIAIFSINQKTGMLTEAGYQSTGEHPRNFGITPNGNFLLCACRDSNKIQVFHINKTTGLLEDTHQDILVDHPVCIQFYPKVLQPGFGDGQFKVIEK